MQRRRYMYRDELVAQISATKDLTAEQVDAVLDGLAEMGVPVDQLVKVTIDEMGVFDWGPERG